MTPFDFSNTRNPNTYLYRLFFVAIYLKNTNLKFTKIYIVYDCDT